MSNPHNTKRATGAELLSTKLVPPHLRPSFIRRETLFGTLDLGLDHKLTLILAPAGFGKSTLASEWLESLGQRGKITSSAWLSLDNGDNDPVRFWRYIIAACQKLAPRTGEKAAALLYSSKFIPVESILTLLINDLARLQGDYVLVLEDYQAITAPRIHEGIAFLLDHLPATLHLVIVTRNTPPLPLARWRASDELRELNAADLRFSLSQTERFLHENLPFQLTPAAIEFIHTRTEGWPAGLRLVALMLQGKQGSTGVEQALENINGGNQHILEYLLLEVFSTLPPALQEFLLKTTFLRRFTPSLCDAVTGGNNSREMLDELERAHLFLINLDESGNWYRYHELFAEAMQHHANRLLGNDYILSLYNRASRWFEREGLETEAIETALQARDYPRAIALIEATLRFSRFSQEIWAVYTLRRWVEQLPREMLKDSPDLCFYYAVALLFTSNRYLPETRARVEIFLMLAENTWQEQGNRDKLGEIFSFRSAMAWWQGDYKVAFDAARQAFEYLPETELFWRSLSIFNLGMEKYCDGWLDQAAEIFTETYLLCAGAGNPYSSRASVLMQAEISFSKGEMRPALGFYDRVIELAEEDLSDKAEALLGQAKIYLEQDELVTAGKKAEKAFELARQYKDEILQMRCSFILAQLQFAREEQGEACDVLQSLALEAQKISPLFYREVCACLARFALCQGNLAGAQNWFDRLNSTSCQVPFNQQQNERLLKVRLLIAEGVTREALRLLDDLLAEVTLRGQKRYQFEIELLMTQAYLVLGDLSPASTLIEKVLREAYVAGYCRVFTAERAWLAPLLKTILPSLQDESLAAFVRALLLDFSRQQSPSSARGLLPAAIPAPFIEPLSQQEQRVLRLLAAGLSNPEIARELVVSINTVKTQVKSIYRKLDITSREAAREVARHLDSQL